ncbi:hypothetical protein DPMN_184650 [Dreissena polymorpha]|uniref:Uncharacterized protein n=1 Tax=Dreissena polymorpha TaxID=45954 RepID=A0A9D4DJJ0_DREPO|nr:hypothetical protein DPMN_184650 [Dreissena polymorpha]
MTTSVDAIHKSSDQINPDQLYVKKKSEFNVNISSDTLESCYISGICILPSGETIVADYTNKRVKMLDKHYNVSSDLEVGSNPQDICIISTFSQVAISNGTSSVHFINIIDGKLKDFYTICEFKHVALGITYHQGDLYIISGTALYQYTMYYTVMSTRDWIHKKTLYEDTGGGITGKLCCKYRNCIFHSVNTVYTFDT